MKTNLMFNFVVDKENKKVKVQREFAAPVTTVWTAWTQAELLDQWWAPKPWKAETRSMDFREGGTWFYSMAGPDGERHYSRADYQTISPQEEFVALDAFCDEEGNIISDFPRSEWNVHFTTAGNTTFVNVEIRHDSLEDLEKIIEMGFREGFTMALENLDQLLKQNRK